MGLKNLDAENLVPKTRLRSCLANIEIFFSMYFYQILESSIELYFGSFSLNFMPVLKETCSKVIDASWK